MRVYVWYFHMVMSRLVKKIEYDISNNMTTTARKPNKFHSSYIYISPPGITEIMQSKIGCMWCWAMRVICTIFCLMFNVSISLKLACNQISFIRKFHVLFSSEFTEFRLDLLSRNFQAQAQSDGSHLRPGLALKQNLLI